MKRALGAFHRAHRYYLLTSHGLRIAQVGAMLHLEKLLLSSRSADLQATASVDAFRRSAREFDGAFWLDSNSSCCAFCRCVPETQTASTWYLGSGRVLV